MIEQNSPPVATYRIQLNKDFTFQQLTDIAPYLRDLGVSHVYLSPVLESAPGSNHGYDTIDFAKISAERGGEAGLLALDTKLAELGLKTIIDIVPNHMGAHLNNPYWRDVLAKGRDSKYWTLFDMRVDDGGKIQLPVLAGSLEDAIAKGDIKLGAMPDGTQAISYGNALYPLEGDAADGELPALLARQNYEFVHWETVKDRVSYRRFFDVNELIGARVEDEKIFELTHGYFNTLAGKLATLDGVRVDHVDGLVDPAGYLARLAKYYDAVWIEKILGRGEAIPDGWRTRGATGYEFTAFLNDAMTDRDGFEAIEDEWIALTQAPWSGFHDAVRAGKTLALDLLFASELKRVATLSALDGDFDNAEVFWHGITVFLPVYRTYFDDRGFSAADRATIERATQLASAYYGDAYDKAAATYLKLLLDPATDRQKQAVREWQQLSGPAMAKGLEDTAHYNYTPLTALNEVGCEANLMKADPDARLEWLNARAKDWPQAMNATSTHDTKRSEDVRARLYALSAMPQDWMVFAHQAIDVNRGLHSPGPAEEYFLYQAILGTWPFDDRIDDAYRARIAQYMKKDMKEAKRRTSWLQPDEAYEKQVLDFTDAVLRHEPFLRMMADLARRVAPAGALNALTVQALKCLLPGQPDIYQGTESWDFSLVDPDNRRPVDYDVRADGLRRLVELDAAQGRLAALDAAVADWTGGLKTWFTRLLLSIRRDVVMPMGELRVNALPIANHGGHLLGLRLTGDDDRQVLLVVPRSPVAGRETARLALPDILIQNVKIEIDGGRSYRDLIGDVAVTIDEIRKPATLLKRFPLLIIAAQ